MSGPYGAAAAFAGVDACIDPKGRRAPLFPNIIQ